jgi:putative protease
MTKKLELVSPGGSLEKIEYAYHYGADAVYVGHPDFSLRARLNDFGEKNLKKAVVLARKLDKKIYFTLNIYAHERHLAKIKKHLAFIKKIKPDAVIVSDPGILGLVKKIAPKIKIHLSTQANTTNSEAVKFWQSQGVSRIVLAREVTLSEIKEIRKKCPTVELEYFVHGAMCMSMSGRCLLSKWMRNRSANLGDCVQPCRWPYRRIAHNTKHITEEDGQKIILEEDSHGTYIFNSKDLCLIEHLDKLAKAGVNAFKIEGRTKSVYYVACVTRAYRKVMDAIKKGRPAEIRKEIRKSKKELKKIVNRGFTTGFLLGKDKWENNFDCSHRKNEYQFVGETCPVESPTQGRGAQEAQFNRVKVHNAIKIGDQLEIITPDDIFASPISGLRDAEGNEAASVHGGSKNTCFVRLSGEFSRKSLLRKKLP